MNFSKFDMVILCVMSVGIVVMSFVFPALGLADADTSENAIPEFDMQSDRFDFASDFPDRPGTPSQGELSFDSDAEDFSDNQVWLQGSDTSDGTDMTLTRNASSNAPRVNLNYWVDGSLNATANETFTSVGDRALMEAGPWDVRVELLEYSEPTNDTIEATVSWEVAEQPTSGGGWLGRIPVVGTLYEGASALPGVVSWLGSVVWWFFTSAWEVALNVLGMTFDVATYLFDTVSWLLGTYGAIMTAAESWVALFVAIPGILLFLEFAKLAMILVSLLPFT